MSITELVNIIEDQGKGVRAYSACARTCRDRLQSRSGLSAAYLLLTITAEKFVDTYDDQPLLSQNAEGEFLRFKNYVDQLQAGEQQTDAATKLDILNRIATDMANHWSNSGFDRIAKT